MDSLILKFLGSLTSTESVNNFKWQFTHFLLMQTSSKFPYLEPLISHLALGASMLLRNVRKFEQL